MMSIIMLAVFSLASLGITTTFSRTMLGSEVQVEVETEEVQERLPSSSVRRVRTCRLEKHPPGFIALRVVDRSLTGISHRPLPVVGHRLANGFLAPLRC